MSAPPPDLLALLPPGAAPAVARWWGALADADRARLAGLWDARVEVRFFAPDPDGLDTPPRVVGGRFGPRPDDGRAEWAPGYFEHLLNHPELVMAVDPASGRAFHFCTAHPAARACRSAGAVPADFACPLHSADCPLAPLRGCALDAAPGVG